MTQEGWYEAIREANWRLDDSADRTLLDLMAKLLAEQDAAKEALRAAGFGCIGMPWPKVVEEVKARLSLVESV